MCSRRFPWFLLLTLTLFNVSAQNTHYDFGFVRNQAVPVIENGHPLSYAWAGGLNSVHFAEIDLDLDGTLDLLGFEKHGNRLLPFLNNHYGFEYAPQYARLFPDLHDWVIFFDYNQDGKPDIFTYGLASIRVFENISEETLQFLAKLKKGDKLPFSEINVKEGETSPPNRYNSGTLIRAMESAGQQIEDEELRAQLKGSGIGTSATRAGILEKLVKNGYLKLNKKTQIVTPTLLGEMITDAVHLSIPSLLHPKLTASWEKGLTMVANGEVKEKDYMEKLSKYVSDYTNDVKKNDYNSKLNSRYRYISQFYKQK